MSTKINKRQASKFKTFKLQSIEKEQTESLKIRYSQASIQAIMDPSWIEFQAENDFIDIVPNFSAPRLALLHCDVGPFKAGLTVQVRLLFKIL